MKGGRRSRDMCEEKGATESYEGKAADKPLHMARKRGGGVERRSEGEMAGKRHDRPHRKSGGWIAGAIKHKNALHEELGVPAGERIPEKKLEKASHSDNPTLRRRANLAKTLKGFHHKD